VIGLFQRLYLNTGRHKHRTNAHTKHLYPNWDSNSRSQRPSERRHFMLIFLIRTLGGGVHTGSTRHRGHYWPIVPAPGDCEDGEAGGMNGFDRGSRSIRREPAPTPLSPPQIPLARPGPTWWEASDKPLQLWRGPSLCLRPLGSVTGPVSIIIFRNNGRIV
jgi:hypothetical protein